MLLVRGMMVANLTMVTTWHVDSEQDGIKLDDGNALEDFIKSDEHSDFDDIAKGIITSQGITMQNVMMVIQ